MGLWIKITLKIALFTTFRMGDGVDAFLRPSLYDSSHVKYRNCHILR
jgi:hypothetical protein